MKNEMYTILTTAIECVVVVFWYMGSCRTLFN